MRLVTWLLLGRILLSAWNNASPADQAELIVRIAQEFCQQQSCHRVKIAISQDEKHVSFYAECAEFST